MERYLAIVVRQPFLQVTLDLARAKLGRNCLQLFLNR